MTLIIDSMSLITHGSIILFLPMTAKLLLIFILVNLRGITCVIWLDPRAQPAGRG